MKHNFKITYSLFSEIYSGIINAKTAKDAMDVFKKEMDDWSSFYKLINIEMIKI